MDKILEIEGSQLLVDLDRDNYSILSGLESLTLELQNPERRLIES